MVFDINTLFKQVSVQLGFGTNAELLEVSYSKVLEFFLKDSLEAIVCKVFIAIQVNLGCYIFFKAILRDIFSIDSVPKSRDFLSLFRVYVGGFLIG